MRKIYTLIRTYVPSALSEWLEDFHKRLPTQPKAAWEYLMEDPGAAGLTTQQFEDWTEAFASIGLVQNIDNAKSPADEEQLDELTTVYFEAKDAINSFFKKFGSPEFTSVQDFIINYPEIARVEFKNLDPYESCIALEEDLVPRELNVKLQLEDSRQWQLLEDTDPKYFELIKNATAKASYWLSNKPDLHIIPVDVMRDVVILGPIADRIKKATKDVKAMVDSNGSSITLNTLESVLESNIQAFASMIGHYPIEINWRDVHLTIYELMTHFTELPEQIVSQHGLNCLCVPSCNKEESKETAIDKKSII